MSRPRLTLCMIVRDEAAMLPQCLASVKGVVDRIVVVDTGSRDATREIARHCGAKLIDHQWRDDFAEARNVALAAVRSGYVLILDADECLAPGAGRTLRRALRKGSFDLGLLPLHDAATLDAAPAEILTGAARRGEAQWLPRLLRHTPDLRYEGSIHESVSAWAVGKRIRSLDAAILHFGAVPEHRRARGKNERNVALLRARLEREPGHAVMRAHLARELERAGQLEAALAESTAGWQGLVAARANGDRLQDVLLPATVHAQLLIGSGGVDAAREALVLARDWSDDHPNTVFLAGVCAEQQSLGADDSRGLLDEAEACYEQCLGATADVRLGELLPGATGWQADLRLATVRLRRGDAERAKQGFARVLAGGGKNAEARLGHAEAQLELGEAESALAELEQAVARGEVDAWALAAEAAAVQGSHADAALFAERASELGATERWIAAHRRERFAAWLSTHAGSALDSPGVAAPPARRSVFAWPSYAEASELDRLLREFGKRLAGRDDVQLFLVHDAQADGDADQAIVWLERAYAAHIPSGESLEVILWTDPLTDAVLGALSEEAVCSIELPESPLGRREAVLGALGLPRVVDADALQRVLDA